MREIGKRLTMLPNFFIPPDGFPPPVPALRERGRL
jgi:hypothetical protein